MNWAGQAFFALHTSTVIAVIVGTVLSFRNPMYGFLPLLASCATHAFLVWCELRQTSPVPLSRRLLRSFSVHVLLTNALFLYVRTPRFAWNMGLGVASLYQALRFAVHYIFPNMPASVITQKVRQLYNLLEGPPQVASQLLTGCEIMSLFQRSPWLSTFWSIAVPQIYVFWYLMFRYATDAMHMHTWRDYNTKFRGLVGKLPTAVAGILLKISEAVASLGNLAMKMYSS